MGGGYWRKLNRQKNKYKLHRPEKKEKKESGNLFIYWNYW
jgi:hypothetical protein